ncbi:MAG TPA: hypothetical protein VKX40_13455, partial [Aequorivita sp.]|nr:hypothetical protein [Aequorivita sp.]
MIDWAKKYRKFLNLSQIGQELKTPLKKNEVKSLLLKIVHDLPENDTEISEKDLSESVMAYHSKKFFEFLKEYYILLASFPLLLGGSLQFFSLMAVG